LLGKTLTQKGGRGALLAKGVGGRDKPGKLTVREKTKLCTLKKGVKVSRKRRIYHKKFPVIMKGKTTSTHLE